MTRTVLTKYFILLAWMHVNSASFLDAPKLILVYQLRGKGNVYIVGAELCSRRNTSFVLFMYIEVPNILLSILI